MNPRSRLLNEWVAARTQSFDASHDVHHAMAVWEWCKVIGRSTLPPGRWDRWSWVLECSAKLHDVWDHKYRGRPGVVTRKQRNDFVRDQLGLSPADAHMVLLICDNVSWSRQVRGERDYHFRKLSWLDRMLCRHDVWEEWRVLLDIVADADRLEALGETGLLRCRTYQKARDPGLNDDSLDWAVVKHAEEKLLLLYPRYFATRKGREEAKPLHKFLHDWVQRKKIEWEGQKKVIPADAAPVPTACAAST